MNILHIIQIRHRVSWSVFKITIIKFWPPIFLLKKLILGLQQINCKLCCIYWLAASFVNVKMWKFFRVFIFFLLLLLSVQLYTWLFIQWHLSWIDLTWQPQILSISGIEKYFKFKMWNCVKTEIIFIPRNFQTQNLPKL